PSAPLPPLTMPSLQDTNTFVGQKVKELAGDLAKLQASLASHGDELDAAEAQASAHAETYHALVGEIEAKLQAGTTIGNPILVDKWNSPRGGLSQMEADVTAMSRAAAHIAEDAGMSSYLLNAVRGAYGIAGAVDEDHANLAKLEEAANAAALRV